MPDSIGPDGAFDFRIVVPDGGLGHAAPVYIDPPAAIGYDYETTGINFASVLLPQIGDSLFGLYLWDAGRDAYVFDRELTAGVEHDFPAGGVSRFRILGIEPTAGLDPTDPEAFPTGVTFVAGGEAQVSMRALVPEPGSLALVLTSLAVIVFGAIPRALKKARR
jgi:hypothetical protein